MSNFNDNAKEIKNKASILYETAKENVAEAYNKTKPEADHLAAKIGETASDLYEESKAKIIETESSIENTLRKSIRNQPLTAILIAAGIGYLWAKLHD